MSTGNWLVGVEARINGICHVTIEAVIMISSSLLGSLASFHDFLDGVGGHHRHMESAYDSAGYMVTCRPWSLQLQQGGVECVALFFSSWHAPSGPTLTLQTKPAESVWDLIVHAID